MKSTEVYRVLREAICPWAKANGFSRAKSGMLGYVRAERAGFLLFWCQCSSFGWSLETGSKLVLEFQMSPSDRLGNFGARTVRKRIGNILGTDDLERMRQVNNQVIRKLPPPSIAFADTLPERYRSLYLSRIEPALVPYTNLDDVWLHYHDEGDVRRWGEFVVDVLPSAVSRLPAIHHA